MIPLAMIWLFLILNQSPGECAAAVIGVELGDDVTLLLSGRREISIKMDQIFAHYSHCQASSGGAAVHRGHNVLARDTVANKLRPGGSFHAGSWRALTASLSHQAPTQITNLGYTPLP